MDQPQQHHQAIVNLQGAATVIFVHGPTESAVFYTKLFCEHQPPLNQFYDFTVTNADTANIIQPYKHVLGDMCEIFGDSEQFRTITDNELDEALLTGFAAPVAENTFLVFHLGLARMARFWQTLMTKKSAVATAVLQNLRTRTTFVCTDFGFPEESYPPEFLDFVSRGSGFRRSIFADINFAITLCDPEGAAQSLAFHGLLHTEQSHSFVIRSKNPAIKRPIPTSLLEFARTKLVTQWRRSFVHVLEQLRAYATSKSGPTTADLRAQLPTEQQTSQILSTDTISERATLLLYQLQKQYCADPSLAQDCDVMNRDTADFQTKQFGMSIAELAGLMLFFPNEAARIRPLLCPLSLIPNPESPYSFEACPAVTTALVLYYNPSQVSDIPTMVSDAIIRCINNILRDKPV